MSANLGLEKAGKKIRSREEIVRTEDKLIMTLNIFAFYCHP